MWWWVGAEAQGSSPALLWSGEKRVPVAVGLVVTSLHGATSAEGGLCAGVSFDR